MPTHLNSLVLDGATHVVREIAQQGDCWREIQSLLDAQPQDLYALLRQTLASPEAQITFCGAGTSSYIGQILAEAMGQNSSSQVRSVPTTDIVSRPDFYFNANSSGVLFSFARSGNSPESMDTAEKVAQLAPNVVQINVTCNPDGAMAHADNSQTRCCLMPERTHDRSFVMTSSFSTMLLFTHQLLMRAAGKAEPDLAAVARVADELNQILWMHPAIEGVCPTDRLVYLGSNTLFGAAREAALKALEMTAGKVVTLAETALGFRHGPKSIVNANTTVCLFFSTHPYTQQFDRDMLIELLDDGTARHLIAVAPHSMANELHAWPHSERLHIIALPESIEHYPDAALAPLHVLVSQVMGLKLALQHGVAPDNPSPSGEVNRVVQGVTRYVFTPEL